MNVFIVTAEANRVPKTHDGIWFHILAVFSKKQDAYQYYWSAICSGEWGEYEKDERGALTDVPTFDSDWQVAVYEQEVFDRPMHFEKEVKENA